MDKAALVMPDYQAGTEILDVLDRSNLDVNLAMWLRTSEYEDWRFAVSSRRLDRAGSRQAYGLVHDALQEAGIPLERTPPLMILQTTDRFVRALHRAFGKAKSVPGMRLGGQMIGDRFIEDAIVYRIQ